MRFVNLDGHRIHAGEIAAVTIFRDEEVPGRFQIVVVLKSGVEARSGNYQVNDYADFSERLSGFVAEIENALEGPRGQN